MISKETNKMYSMKFKTLKLLKMTQKFNRTIKKMKSLWQLIILKILNLIKAFALPKNKIQ